MEVVFRSTYSKSFTSEIFVLRAYGLVQSDSLIQETRTQVL